MPRRARRRNHPRDNGPVGRACGNLSLSGRQSLRSGGTTFHRTTWTEPIADARRGISTDPCDLEFGAAARTDARKPQAYDTGHAVLDLSEVLDTGYRRPCRPRRSYGRVNSGVSRTCLPSSVTGDVVPVAQALQ